jgi:hypothetical protein
MFEDVRKVFEEEKDVRKAVERLRQLGYNVEELRYEGELVGYRVGDVYIARRPSAWGEPESWMAAEIPDADVGYRWAVGYRFGSAWGDLSFVQRELEKKMRIKALDDWMKSLEQYGYRVRKVPWESGAVPGFTYIIEKDGRRVGEVQLAEIGGRLDLVKAGIPSAIDDPIAAARYLIYRHELGPHLERYGNVGGVQRTGAPNQAGPGRGRREGGGEDAVGEGAGIREDQVACRVHEDARGEGHQAGKIQGGRGRRRDVPRAGGGRGV